MPRRQISGAARWCSPPVVLAVAVLLASSTVVLAAPTAAPAAVFSPVPSCAPATLGSGPARLLGLAAPAGVARCRSSAGPVRSGSTRYWGYTDVPMTSHGGDVMGDADTSGVTVTPIYWQPSTLPSGVTSRTTADLDPLDRFLGDVAAASGTGTGIFSTLTEYGDAAGAGSYRITAANAAVDADALPSSGCTLSPDAAYANGDHYVECVTATQLDTELANFVTAQHLPGGFTQLYSLFLPRGVEVCFDAQATSCTPSDQNPNSSFCGYHTGTWVGGSASVYFYSVEPFAGEGCGGGIDSVAGPPGTDGTLSIWAHELAEAITDPTGEGWRTDSGGEIGDLCAWDAPAVGTDGAGHTYDQTFGADHYLIQSLFSNRAYAADPSAADAACVLAEPPVVTHATTTTITEASATTVGDAATVTAQVASDLTTSGAPAPTGSVTISDGISTCSGNLSGTDGVSTASCALGATTAGSVTLTATYGANPGFLGSAGSGSREVDLGTTTVTLSAGAASVGGSTTVAVSVTQAHPGAAALTPTGSVAISDGSSQCVAELSGTAGQASGSCTLDEEVAGSVALTASYGGDAKFAAASATPLALTIAQAVPAVQFSSLVVGPAGQGTAVSVMVVAPVTGGAAATPTGSVQVTGASGSCSATLAGSGGQASGSCTVVAATAGKASFTATYLGDANFSAQRAESAAVTIAKATTMVASGASLSALVGWPTTLSATIRSTGASPTPSGRVVLQAGALRCAATLVGQAGVATGHCTVVPLAAATVRVIATYAGDSNTSGVTGVASSLVVRRAPVHLQVAASATSVPFGHEALVLQVAVVASPQRLAPTGTVVVASGRTRLCVVALRGGRGHCALPATGLPRGRHLLAVSYLGDVSNAPGATAVWLNIR